jgi:putative hydrolase of the HAD superfamily
MRRLSCVLSSRARAVWAVHARGPAQFGRSGRKRLRTDPERAIPLRGDRPFSWTMHIMDGSNMSSIQAVIWDFGGVISESPFEAFSRFERERGLPKGFLRGINATNPDHNAWAQLERSACTVEQFDELFEQESRAAGHPVRGAQVLALLDGAIRPAMVQALRCLRPRMKIGLITNNFRDASDPVNRGDKGEILQLFHHVIESAKAGVRKPDPRIYRMMLDALQVHPTQCVYLDDLGINLKPAREMGMHTIKVGEAEAALAQLESLVGFPLVDA